jgi:hypothetical protein
MIKGSTGETVLQGQGVYELLLYLFSFALNLKSLLKYKVLKKGKVMNI